MVPIAPLLSDSGLSALAYCTLGRRVIGRSRCLTNVTSQIISTESDETRITVDTIPSPVWRCLTDGSVEFLNQRWLDYTGFSLEQGLGWGWQNAIHPDDLAGLMATWRAVLATEAHGEAEARLRRFDGAYRWCLFRAEPLRDRTGKVVRWWGTNTDIEDRKQAEEQIRQAERSLQLAIDTIPVMAWRSNAVGDMDSLNKRWRDYTGLTLEDAKGWRWAEVNAVHPDDLEDLIATWKAILASGRAGQAEARIRRFDGEYRWFLFRTEPLLDDMGRPVQWYGTMTDLEDRRRSEEALQQMQTQLAHVSRLTTLGELAASIAHEVNQPLAAIATYGEAGLRWLARGEGAGIEEASRAFKSIIKDADRAGAVIRQIRGLAKKSEPQFCALDLNETIGEVTLMMERPALSRRISLASGLASGLPLVLGDRVQLQQVIINLFINAMEAMDDVADRSRELTIRSEPHQDGKILVSIQDTGPGIDPQDFDRMFNAFYSTKQQGLGMGLSICRSIIEAHGGRIWAIRNSNPGATFQFTLKVWTGK